MVIVRYADDFVLGFQYTGDARRMRTELQQRLAKFRLMLHEGKTRLIEFGRLPALARKRRGARRPETFAFLGFTHFCGWTRDGRFVVKRKTQSRRMTAKLKTLKQEARRRLHAAVADQHRWLSAVLRGHYTYYCLPSNFASLSKFFCEVRRLWYRTLRRRCRQRMTWARFEALVEIFPLPRPRITHPYWAGSSSLG